MTGLFPDLEPVCFIADEPPIEDDAFSDVLNEMVDELVLGLCFHFHRSVKIGFYELTDGEIIPEEYRIIDQLGLDIFGHGPGKRPVECLCPNCSRNMAASRFAPHLEKCMGMGRNSSRVASRRLANTGKMMDDDEEDFFLDDDWTLNGEKRLGGSKKKRDKNPNSPRRSKIFKKNGDPPRPGTPSSDSLPAYKAGLTLQAFEGLSLEEKRTLLSKTCGVISEHTSKMCTKTQRCPQHTDDQRRSIRLLLLGQTDTLPLRFRSDGFPLEQDEIQVDVDGFDDADGQSLRDSLNRINWEEESNVSFGDEDASLSPPNMSNNGTNRSKKKLKHRKKKMR